jgi:hypothetical protein
MHLTPFSKVTTTLDKVTDPSTGYKFINQYCMLEEIGRGTFGKVCVLELYELWMMVLVCTCVRVWCERADTAVFFWIETLSYPKSKNVWEKKRMYYGKSDIGVRYRDLCKMVYGK